MRCESYDERELKNVKCAGNGKGSPGLRRARAAAIARCLSLLLSAALSVMAVCSACPATASAGETGENAEVKTRSLARQVADYAKSWVGRISYRLGANERLHEGGESDCSWFLFHVFNDFGLLDEWQKSTTWGKGLVSDTEEVASIEEARPGDVLFWEEGYDENGTLRGHVVLYIGALQVVGCNGSSPTTGAVMLTPYRTPGGGREPDSIWRLRALSDEEKLLFGCRVAAEAEEGHRYVFVPICDRKKVLYIHRTKKKKSVRYRLRAADFSGSKKGVFRAEKSGTGGWTFASYAYDGVLTADGDVVRLDEPQGYASQSFHIKALENGGVSLLNDALGDPVALYPSGGRLAVRLGAEGIPDPAAATAFYMVDVTDVYDADAE